ncbi:MAG: hypothetical protein H0X25_00900 [Acidobacteriales bacterium]|nr:hypothetical protein [Terriglobales bacterium]
MADSFLDLPGLGAASSFLVDDNGTLTSVTSTLGNGNASTCWMVLTNDGRHAFVTEPLSHALSSYRVHHDGNLTLLNANAATLATGDPRD